MPEFTVTRLLQNPLGHTAPEGARGDIVKVSNGWATIYLDPADYDRSSEGELLRKLAELDPRPHSVIGTDTPAGGQAMTIHRASRELRPTP
ncbi:MAG TPA: hypothetical protein VFA63_05890 [Pseudonocardiaceae bacterium]|jgi:hypothetical protein|nr:hypothetical protein [Pseudonocardiaceae bacterium]